MRAAVSFDEVLDRTLEDAAPGAVPVDGAGPRVATATAFGFFHLGGAEEEGLVRPTGHPYGWSRLRDAGRLVSSPRAQPEGDATRADVSHASRMSRLTPEQHVALGDLRALGAPLRADFTRDELRSAFRTLARRFHPDRHPGAADSVKTELSLLFRRLRSAYTTLSRD